MTLETCKKQYAIAKEKGNQEAMKLWAGRAGLHGGSIKEEKKEKPKK